MRKRHNVFMVTPVLWQNAKRSIGFRCYFYADGAQTGEGGACYTGWFEKGARVNVVHNGIESP